VYQSGLSGSKISLALCIAANRSWGVGTYWAAYPQAVSSTTSISFAGLIAVSRSAVGILSKYLLPTLLAYVRKAELAPILMHYVPSVEAIALAYVGAGTIGVSSHVNQNLMSC
jgi:hypothetical protein